MFGAAVWNLYDFRAGRTKPSHETWEKMHNAYPEIFTEPVYIDDSGETYALTKVKVEGHKIKIVGNKNKVKIGDQNVKVKK